MDKRNLLYCFFLFQVFILLFSRCSPSKDSNDPNDYYENGQVRIEKLIHGDSAVWKFYYEDGRCWEHNYYYKDEKYKVVTFLDTCIPNIVYTLKNGKRDGKWIVYYRNGKIYQEGYYQEGFTTGMFNSYDSIGKLESMSLHLQSDWVKNQFPLNFSLAAIKKKIAHLPYKIENQIEVAGDQEYYFPYIQIGDSEIHFDEKEENEELVLCREGILRDSLFVLESGIKVGMTSNQLSELFNLEIPEKCLYLTLRNYNAPFYEFSFQFINNRVSEITFGLAESHY